MIFYELKEYNHWHHGSNVMHFTTRENINKEVAQGQLFCAGVLVHFVLKV
jgi:hypothetical protein